MNIRPPQDRRAPVAPRRLIRRLCCLFALACAAGSASGQSFAPAVSYPVGSDTRGLVLADFDGDGALDIATANGAGNDLSVARGGGDGTFRAAVNYPTGRQPSAVAAGDFNRDGHVDLVVADLTPGGFQSFSVLLGNGDATFQPRKTDGEGARVTQIAAGDLNGDGGADLVAVYSDSNVLVTRLGNGDGTLAGGTSYPLGRPPRDLVVRDFNRDGKPDVAAAVEGFEPTGVVVLLNKGDGTLLPPVRYEAETDFIAQITAGDYDGDGHVDLAATSLFSGGRISVLLGNGDGTFRPKLEAAGPGSDRLASADLDGDGKLDLLTLQGGGAGRLGILGGGGDGTFRPARSYAVNGQAAELAAADLDGDGKTDLITAQAGSVSVLINRSGALAIRGVVTDQGGAPLGNVTVTLGDGTPAATATGADGSYSFTALAAGGDYTVTPARPNYTFSPPRQTFASLSADRTANFVGTLRTYTLSGVVRGGGGAGVAGVTLTLGGAASATTTTDEDGRYSFANVPGGGNYTLTPSAERRAFSPASRPFNNLSSDQITNFLISLAGYSVKVSVADAGGSGVCVVNPLVTLSGAVNRTAGGANFLGSGNFEHTFTNVPVGGNYAVALSYPESPFTNLLLEPPTSRGVNDLSSDQSVSFAARCSAHPVRPNPFGIARADFNGDGKADVVTANSVNSSISVLLGNGDGTLGAALNLFLTSSPAKVAVADFNGDGRADVATANQNPSNVAVLLGNGDGTFQAARYFLTGESPSHLALSDLNGDGKLDIVTANTLHNNVSVLLGNADGSFRPNVNYPAGGSASYVVAADFNADGKPDVAVGRSVLLGNGDGTLRPAAQFETFDLVYGGTSADFNGDGRADIALIYPFTEERLVVYFARADGTLQRAAGYRLDFQPNQLTAGDFNSDGKLDLAAITSFGVGLSLGNGDGTFQENAHRFYGSNFIVGAVGDYNGDSRPDIALTNMSGGGHVSVLLNRVQTSLQFGVTAYTAGEGAGRAQITITRSGDLGAPSAVRYRTLDDPAPVRCDAANGTAYARCDYATAADVLAFAAGERQKTVLIPVIDDAHAEGDETFQIELSAADGAVLTGQRVVKVTITDNDASPGPNPIGGNSFFVRQHYLDFLSREPEAGEPWTAVLDRCPDVNNDPSCGRLLVSQSFFQSPEFYLKGYYAYLFYRVAVGRRPEYAEIVSDMRELAGQTADEVFRKRAGHAVSFARRQEFEQRYSLMDDRQYVGALLGRYQLQSIVTEDPRDPEGAAQVTLTGQQLVEALAAGTLTRAQVLRAVVQSSEVDAAEYHGAFVSMQYYGYLRRAPEEGGYQSWLSVIRQDPNNVRVMVNGFANSQEYLLRFGRP